MVVFQHTKPRPIDISNDFQVQNIRIVNCIIFVTRPEQNIYLSPNVAQFVIQYIQSLPKSLDLNVYYQMYVRSSDLC